MNENYNEEPKKSGTVLKVILIIITLISLVAAAAMGLLYYNATTNLGLVREKNEALGVDRDKYKTLAAEYEAQIGEFEQEIADLSKQLSEAQAMVEMPTIAGQETQTSTEAKTEGGETKTEGEETTKAPEDGQEGVVNLNNVKTLDVKPAKLYDAGKEYTVIVAGLNLRSGPATSYRIVESVSKNAVVTAYAEDGEWLMVKTEDGTYGWAKSNFVKAK